MQSDETVLERVSLDLQEHERIAEPPILDGVELCTHVVPIGDPLAEITVRNIKDVFVKLDEQTHHTILLDATSDAADRHLLTPQCSDFEEDAGFEPAGAVTPL